ncbi:MAG: DUF4178 domain-containing protein [Desulfobacterales bacterium]|nr:DUF4178 domain-containing protein [Desulfobacterales bacterium]MBF0396355.1 DUF4178 domain-containing protein [Desulfobacterales bacterium]
MGIIDFFKSKSKKQEPDILSELTLGKLKVGYLLDYDMKTWEVTGYNYYDWRGVISHEWQLKSDQESVYLEMESDDETYFTLSRTIPFNRLGQKVKTHILDTGDPPETIVYDGVTYHLEVTGAGYFYKDGKGPAQELISWTYADEKDSKNLNIEQWGENDFEASTGISVEEYQFTNILPRQI